MSSWSALTRDERTAAIVAGAAAGLAADKLARLHKTAATAIEQHAARAGISLVDDTGAKGGQPGADAGRRKNPPAGSPAKETADTTPGGRHVTPKLPTASEPAPRAPIPVPATSTDPANSGWSEARISRLRELVAEKYTASQIAKFLGGAVSRNAVVGKAARLGLTIGANDSAKLSRPRVKPSRPQMPSRAGRPQTTFFKAKPAAEPRAPRVHVPKARPDLPEPISLNLTLLQLGSGQCRYPSATDDITTLTFCGAPQFNERAYCEYHCRLAYIPRDVRDRVDRRLGVNG